ncbi:Ring finger domain [seawater metagenome]|uniref:Ring finger domain n=1 Tax=seawater metagenome TaxID=1561972 RepID=A0A5E8CK88_9ZZZZ
MLNESNIDNKCMICLNNNKNDTITINCGHKFHNKCLKKWLLTQENIKYYNEYENMHLEGTCPICRQTISKIFISEFDDENFNDKNISIPLVLLSLLWRAVNRIRN